jgi:hypothetical protein
MVTSAWVRRVFALSAAAMLASCGQNASFSPPAVRTAAGAAPSGAASDDSRGCPSAHCIIVGNGPRYSGQTGDLLFFSRRARKDAPPEREIAGSKTKLGYINGIAVDSHGNVYAANAYGGTIDVFAAGAQGNVAPTRTIVVSKRKQIRLYGAAVDGSDYLYVASQYPDRITVYAPNANGDGPPVRVIRGKRTGLSYPWGVAFDSSGNLYVSNSSSITVYAPTADGDVKPIREISGSDTQLSASEGIALDDSGYTYVVSDYCWCITVYAPGANGDARPARVLDDGLYGPVGIAVDARKKIYVTNVGYDDPPFLTVLATVTNQHYKARTIDGKKTRLQWPVGIFVR